MSEWMDGAEWSIPVVKFPFHYKFGDAPTELP